MEYNKFGECAIQAYEKMIMEKCSALKAWITTAEELFGAGSSSSKKSCPKHAFLGVVDPYHKKNKNADYALEALAILSNTSKETFETVKPLEFWRDQMKKTIQHNSQIDVVFALWSNDLFYKMIIVKKSYIKDVKEFLDKVKELKSEKDNKEVFFRGVANEEYGINGNNPKIFRGYIDHENEIINDTIVHNYEYFRNCKTAIEKLELLQHYGIPTRLLDITRNPLVALYFACLPENKNGYNRSAEKNGEVILYYMEREYIKYNDSDAVSILANLAFMPGDFRLPVNKDAAILKGNSNYKKLIHQIRSEKSHFNSSIYKKHLKDYILCVIPNLNNKKIIAQQGAFLLYGMQDGIKRNPSRFYKKGDQYMNYSEISIDGKSKEAIIKELATLGISHEVLFPELENYIKVIDKKYKTDSKEGLV